MSHFAKVSNDIVETVIVAELDFFNSFIDNSPGQLIETSYTGAIRKNFAAIGYTYDSTRDAFIPPKPFASWTLVEDTCQWAAPVAYPDDGKTYYWDEETTNWMEAT